MSTELNFDKEYKMIEEELKNNNNFYKETKSHFDEIKQSRSHGTLSFIHLQTANLISIKNSKLDLIKELISIKKNKAEFDLKSNQNSSIDGEQYKGIAIEMLKAISNNRKDLNFNSLMINDKKDKLKKDSNQSEKDVDKELEERLERTKKKKKKKTKLDNKYIYATDKNGIIYCLDKNYNILEDKTLPNWKITFKGHGEHLKAFNQYGKEIEIIEFED